MAELVVEQARATVVRYIPRDHVGPIVTQSEDHVVPGHGGHALPQPPCLSQGVGQQGERGAPRLMVGLAVVRRDDAALRGRQDRPAEPEEPVHRLHPEHRPPVTHRGRPASRDGDEVDGIGLPEQRRAVTGHPSGGLFCASQVPSKGSANRTAEALIRR
jgi:hypothetical protein